MRRMAVWRAGVLAALAALLSGRPFGQADVGGIASGSASGSVARRRAGPFIGACANALDVNPVTGPPSCPPASEVGAGYRFSDGSVLSVDCGCFTTAFYHAATLVPPGLQIGQDQAASSQDAGPPFEILYEDVQSADYLFGGIADKRKLLRKGGADEPLSEFVEHEA